MKKHVCGLVLLVVLSAVSVLASASAAGLGAGDRVVGGARDAFDANVSVSAQSGPGGEGAHGHINATLPFPGSPGDTIQVRINVTCLAVAGNLAAAGGFVTEASANDVPPGTSFVVVFRDTGQSGGVGDAVEPFLGAPAASCADLVPFAEPALPVRSGNVHIHDGA